MSAEQPQLDIMSSIAKHISMLKPTLPTHALISIGEYSTQLLRKPKEKKDLMLSLFIQKINSLKADKITPDDETVLGIGTRADTHYWFNVQQYLARNPAFLEKLRSKPIEKADGAIMVASVSEGVGSAFLPILASEFQESNVNALAFSILPSEVQPPDAFFNAVWSIATGYTNGLTQVLIGRDGLESYVGVDRRGVVLRGNGVLNYILDVAFSKETFVQELCELSRSYGVKTFMVFSATGASLRVHGTLENIMATALLRPFLTADVSSATVLYVLVRMPLQLKDKLSRGKIELTIINWFRDKADLKSVYVSEPVYVEDGSDRLDLLMFLGGFELTGIVSAAEKKTRDIKRYAVSNEFIKEEEWQSLIKSLTA